MKSRQIRAMGTIIDILILDTVSDAFMMQLEAKLRAYEHRFSANDPTSELMQINLNAGVKAITAAPELYSLIKLGCEHSLASHSRLNIAIGPLVQTWRIGFADARLPAPEEIQHALQLIDPGQIVLNDALQTVFLKKAGMKLDLGALAKGYIADLLIAELKEQQVKAGLLNLGGNVLTFGSSSHDDGLWRIGIRDPAGHVDDLKHLLKISGKSVVTSGIYERTLETAGHKYHHIFDPATGYPAETEVVSLTIVSDASVTGEIWTTRLFGYSPAEILRQTAQVPEIEALILLKDGTEFQSAGMTAYL